ncbi:Uncharacterised protein [Mycobacteroides abscessus subsp. abscessus]|uniref:hypothetical protein n=1 Tax=Mycobacteroides abscessus TaxID=36809 RepID=UPI000929D73F|nr:hypothetical protein [Mycobacteroides abscessus]SIH24705.1 Uncharacterised protein [Mycobacteroides abscessus subsp. abscessus]
MSTPSGTLHPAVDALLERARTCGIKVRRSLDLIVLASSGRPPRRFRPEFGAFTHKQQRKLITELVERGMRISLDEVPEELHSDHLRERLSSVHTENKARQCPNPQKLRFPDSVAAALAMDRIENRHGQHFSKNLERVYRCRCGGWHIRTTRPRTKPEIGLQP